MTQHADSDLLIQESQKLAKQYFNEALEELKIHVDDFPIVYLSATVLDQKTSVMLKAQWEKTFGIRCEVEVANWRDHFKKMTTGEYKVLAVNSIKYGAGVSKSTTKVFSSSAFTPTSSKDITPFFLQP